jgi:fructose-bisphosphate aldolase, class II
MSHVTLKEILADAKIRKYTIPCLAALNIESILGILKAAEEKQSPMILCYNKQLTPDIPIEMLMPVMVDAAKKSKVPVATTLDHGSDFDLIMKAIHYGSSSVMFDGSGLPFGENVAKTKEIVKIAHSLGVAVEAELGGVGGNVREAVATSAIESIFTVPEEAVEFVRATGVDCLAISFGNVHGRYTGAPKLDLERVKKIASMLDVPLVMHGASGLEEYDYGRIIDAGISKLNYFSAMCRVMYSRLKSFLENAKEDAFCINTIPMSVDFWFDETKKLLDICRCSGKAGSWDSISQDRIIGEISEIIAGQVRKYLK